MGWSIFKEGGGDSAARSWAQQFLSKIGAPVTPDNIDFVYQWEKRAAGFGKYNPLGLPPVSGHPELGTGATGSAYNLGPVKSYVSGYANQLGRMFGIKSEGGWRKSDPFPDHPSGHAVDFMITDLGSGGVASKNPTGKSVGDRLAAYAVANYKALGIKYVIWNHRVWTPAKGWHDYDEPGQGPHDDHVHITFNDSPGTSPPVSAADYASWDAGLQASYLQLQTDGYGGVLQALRTGDTAAATKALGTVASVGDGAFQQIADVANVSGNDANCAWYIKGLGGVGDTCVFSKVTVRHLAGIGLIASSVVVGLVGVVILVYYGLSDKAVAMIPGAGAAKNVVGKVL